jgi:hypothetical protein
MRPGEDCMSCHDGSSASQWTVAGTIFSASKADPTQGRRGIAVLVTDAAGSQLTLETNDAGNFYSAEPLQFPIMVQAQSSTVRMAMQASVSNGSCNGCHADPPANLAPGRLFVP